MAYYPERQAPYNFGPNDPYSVVVGSNFIPEPSQRLFWGNGGSNQVGGSGLWNMLTNKFPFLGQMFGRLEQLPAEYSAPQISTQYGVPTGFQPQYYQQTYQGQQYQQQPQFFRQQQVYQPPQVYQQSISQFRQSFPGRDVGFTDDAIIVTPPQVPIIPPQPAPVPQPAPIPQPAPVPQPVPTPSPGGYTYNKPQYRLELPHK